MVKGEGAMMDILYYILLTVGDIVFTINSNNIGQPSNDGGASIVLTPTLIEDY